jgi:hypothetical protein
MEVRCKRADKRSSLNASKKALFSWEGYERPALQRFTDISCIKSGVWLYRIQDASSLLYSVTTGLLRTLSKGG